MPSYRNRKSTNFSWILRFLQRTRDKPERGEERRAKQDAGTRTRFHEFSSVEKLLRDACLLTRACVIFRIFRKDTKIQAGDYKPYTMEVTNSSSRLQTKVGYIYLPKVVRYKIDASKTKKLLSDTPTKSVHKIVSLFVNGIASCTVIDANYLRTIEIRDTIILENF